MFKQKGDPAVTTLSPADAVQQARTRARRRLIGAVVLLGIGIIGFPLVFETQPRPIPVDIPIEIPRKDSVPPLVAPPAPPLPLPLPSAAPGSAPAAESARPEIITESRSDAARDVTPPPPAAAAVASVPAARASSVATGHVAAASAASAPKPVETAKAESARARALLEGRTVPAADAQRFVVQVGAFADAEAARGTRQKVEKLGLKTYTQVAQTAAGSRIRVRVGPFASRADADAALAKARAAGIDAVVLTL